MSEYVLEVGRINRSADPAPHKESTPTRTVAGSASLRSLMPAYTPK